MRIANLISPLAYRRYTLQIDHPPAPLSQSGRSIVRAEKPEGFSPGAETTGRSGRNGPLLIPAEGSEIDG